MTSISKQSFTHNLEFYSKRTAIHTHTPPNIATEQNIFFCVATKVHELDQLEFGLVLQVTT